MSRALSQVLAIHAAPNPRITDKAIKMKVRELMAVSPYLSKEVELYEIVVPCPLQFLRR
ncbi:hypothetical protein D3C85_1467800 [compost metagenome]